MPKCNLVKVDKTKEQDMLIIERIIGRTRAANMNGKEVAKRAGIQPSTYYSRLRTPGTFRIWELRSVYKVLKIEEDDTARKAII
ncbi:MAG: hypothetical protein PHS82_06360 [Lachnospiraceae bacterium]|nr:hypothetical protein [Lachnospiraceae bacterium]